jgi:hypothetical protein
MAGILLLMINPGALAEPHGARELSVFSLSTQRKSWRIFASKDTQTGELHGKEKDSDRKGLSEDFIMRSGQRFLYAFESISKGLPYDHGTKYLFLVGQSISLLRNWSKKYGFRFSKDTDSKGYLLSGSGLKAIRVAAS